MKKAINFLLGAVAVVAISAGVAGVTSYSLMQPEQNKTLAFDEVFQTGRAEEGKRHCETVSAHNA